MSFMQDEIHEQPALIRRIVFEQMPSVQALADAIKRRGIAFAYFAARGTSDHAAIYGKYLLETRNGLPVALAAPSVFTLYHQPPRLGPNALVVGISQSGAGPDVIEVIRAARASGALTACIVNTPDSPLAQAAEFPLFIDAGIEKSVAATKTYTGSLAMIALLSCALDPDPITRLPVLLQAADTMARLLDSDATIVALAERYASMRECVTLARGYNQATAQEAALKLIETCYVGARAYSTADFQHGPIAQVEAGLACLVFAPEGAAFAGLTDLAERLRASDTSLLCIGHDRDFLALSEAAIAVPDAVPEWVSPLVYIVAAQMFAYHLAIARGNDPDAPRGLNKITRTT